MLEISLVGSLFFSCSGEFLLSVFIVLLFTNLFLFAKLSLFIQSYSYFMASVVYLLEHHLRIFVFEGCSMVLGLCFL